MPVWRKHSERAEERRQIFLDRSEKTIVEICVRVFDRNDLSDRNQQGIHTADVVINPVAGHSCQCQRMLPSLQALISEAVFEVDPSDNKEREC